MAWLNGLKTEHKLAVQAVALALTALAALPLYVGLQSASDGVAWAGLLVACAGMALGLWVS